MPSFTLNPDPALWSVVPGAEDELDFVEDLCVGLEGEARETARAMARFGVSVRGHADDVTLLLREPNSSLYAVATFALYADRTAPGSESEALELVTDGQVGPWEPTVVPVALGAAAGFRVSEPLEAPVSPEPEGDFTALEFIQTTYVVSVAGRLGTVALTPAPISAAGVLIALVEPVLATWELVG